MIPKRQLGETKYAVSLFSLGGEATLNKPELKIEIGPWIKTYSLGLIITKKEKS